MSPYAKAYFYGTDGSAALAGSPISNARPAVVMPRRKPKQAKGLHMPIWVVLLVVAGIVFVLSFVLLNMRSETASTAKDISTLRIELAKEQEIIDSLELKINQASDPERIHSIAVNRLGMRLPTDDQITVLSMPTVLADTDTKWEPLESIGLFKILLSLVGL